MSETSSQLTPSQKELLSPTVKLRPEIEALSPEHPEPPPLSLVTPMMARRPELDCQVEPEEPSQESAEL
jgi:hypothetical protein